MTHNTWARKYLKTMCKNFMTAFQMGYADGTAGNERQSPPFPEEAKPGTLVYAATLTSLDKGTQPFVVCDG